MEFAARAGKPTDGLTGGTLSGGPLRLLVTCGTGVRAHGTIDTVLPDNGVPEQVAG